MKHEVIALDSQTWIIKEGEGLSGVYMYLLAGTEKAVLIDTGYGSFPLDEVCKELTSMPIEVLLTHGHMDHIGGTGAFKTVYIKAVDYDLYKEHSKKEIRMLFSDEKLYPVKREVTFIEGNEEIDLGGRKIKLISTPGHTRGCICVLDESRRWLFTGDTCCKASVLFTVGNAASFEEYKESLELLIGMEELYDTTWPSHHSYPVEKDIIHQFRVAVNNLIEGKEKGEKVETIFGSTNIYRYKDIAIEY